MSATKPTKRSKRKPAQSAKSTRTAKSSSSTSIRTRANAADTSNTPQAREQALRDLQGVLRAIPKSKLLRIHASPDIIGKLVLERTHEIAPYLPRIARLPEVNHFWVNNLAKIALALLAVRAHRLAARNKPRADLAAAYQSGSELKGVLHDWVRILIRRKLLPGDCLDTIEVSRSYTGTGRELTALAKLLRHHAAAIHGKTPITPEDIARAAALGGLLTREGEARFQRTQMDEDAALLYQQAYTLLVLAYDEVRRCIRFLDAGAEPRVVPSLFQNRGRKKNTEGASERAIDAELGGDAQ